MGVTGFYLYKRQSIAVLCHNIYLPATDAVVSFQDFVTILSQEFACQIFTLVSNCYCRYHPSAYVAVSKVWDNPVGCLEGTK